MDLHVDGPHFGPQIHPMVHYEAVPDDQSYERGGAVAKLLESDLTWASKYLRSDNLTPASSANQRPSALATRSVYTDNCYSRERSGSSDEDDARPYRLRLSPSPKPVWMASERRSLSRQRTPDTPPTPCEYFSRPYQPAESPCAALPLRSYNSKAFGTHLFEPKMYTSAQTAHKPEISETRKRLRKILCQSKNDPHFYD